MTLSEREEISREALGVSIERSMARLLGHSPSTVAEKLAGMAAMIDTERRWLRRLGSELVVRKRCKLAKVRGYDRQWRGS